MFFYFILRLEVTKAESLNRDQRFLGSFPSLTYYCHSGHLVNCRNCLRLKGLKMGLLLEGGIWFTVRARTKALVLSDTN